jgi:hypothetical protein
VFVLWYNEKTTSFCAVGGICLCGGGGGVVFEAGLAEVRREISVTLN